MKKRIISLLLAVVLCLSLIPAAAASSDTSGHWAADTIADWQQKGYISGYADGSFRPNSSITRAEFIKIMNRVLGLTAEATISFSDVRESDWFYAEIAKAVAAGYAKGNTDGTFRPNAPITRAEAAAMLARAFKLTENEARAAQFKDAASIPAWAKGSVGAVAEAGYMTGYPDGSFGASGNITRAEAVVTADRAERAAAEASTKKPASSGSTGSGGSSGGTVTPPAQKTSVTGVQPVADVMVDYDTSEADAIAQLPNEVTLTCTDGTTVSASVANWKLDSNYNAIPLTTTDYTATGTVTIPKGYTYDGTLTATAKLTVRGADKTVKSAQQITNIEVATGTLTDEAAAMKILPSGVTLLDITGTKIKDVIAKISGWKLKDGTTFDGNTAGSYTFVGTVTIPDGYTYNGTLTAEATIAVKPAGDVTLKEINNIICDIPDVYIDEFTLKTEKIRAAINQTVKLPETATLKCNDGSYVEVALSLPNDFTSSSTTWSGSDVKSNNADRTYPYFYKLSHKLDTSDTDITLPAGYSMDGEVTATFTAHIKDLDTASWENFKEAYKAAQALQEKIPEITDPADATDAGKIYIVPTGTRADAITKGVRFVVTSEAVTNAYKALTEALTDANYPYNDGEPHNFNSKTECTDMTAALKAAVKTVGETIPSNPQTGTAVNDAYVVGLVKIWLENQDKAPWSKEAVLQPGDNTYTLPESNTFIESEGLGARRIDVSLEWTLPEELQENSNDKHLEIKQTPDEPTNVTLTATLKTYSINGGASVTSDRKVGEYTALLGAPLAEDTTATIVDKIPELSSGAEPSNITVAVPLRGLQGTNQNIDKIQIPDPNDIKVEEIGNDLLHSLELTSIDESDSASTAAGYRFVNIYLKAGANPITRPAGSIADYTTATIEITIPSEYITLTKDAINKGWYLPKDGVVLTAQVRVLYPTN